MVKSLLQDLSIMIAPEDFAFVLYHKFLIHYVLEVGKIVGRQLQANPLA